MSQCLTFIFDSNSDEAAFRAFSFVSTCYRAGKIELRKLGKHPWMVHAGYCIVFRGLALGNPEYEAAFGYMRQCGETDTRYTEYQKPQCDELDRFSTVEQSTPYSGEFIPNTTDDGVHRTARRMQYESTMVDLLSAVVFSGSRTPSLRDSVRSLLVDHLSQVHEVDVKELDLIIDVYKDRASKPSVILAKLGGGEDCESAVMNQLSSVVPPGAESAVSGARKLGMASLCIHPQERGRKTLYSVWRTNDGLYVETGLEPHPYLEWWKLLRRELFGDATSEGVQQIPTEAELATAVEGAPRIPAEVAKTAQDFWFCAYNARLFIRGHELAGIFGGAETYGLRVAQALKFAVEKLVPEDEVIRTFDANLSKWRGPYSRNMVQLALLSLNRAIKLIGDNPERVPLVLFRTDLARVTTENPEMYGVLEGIMKGTLAQIEDSEEYNVFEGILNHFLRHHPQ